MPEFLLIIIGVLVGIVLGYFVARYVVNASIKKKESEVDSLIQDAQQKADTIKREAAIEAKDEAFKMRADIEKERKERQKSVQEAEVRIQQREASLDKRLHTLDDRENQLAHVRSELSQREQNLEQSEQAVQERLEEVASMTSEQAKQELLDSLKDEVAIDSAAIIKEAQAQAQAEADKKARSIISSAIQRLASEHTSDITVSSFQLPSDDIKGRIIGREGRNIRSFEQITGTNLIIDDNPECVAISCFDPVRREIASLTMEALISDGRIHPARIEELFAKAEKHVNQRVIEAGEQAAFDAGIHDLHRDLVVMLGRLHYRTSYRQNVLDHSLEVAYLCGMMASELGINPTIAKRAGLLHDIGKALSSDVQGSHAVIGADLARRFDEKDIIVHAIEAHHNDVESNSVIDVLVQAADAISAARPGARKESFDAYIKRLEKLEEIAKSYEGVERTFAIQAGREVRVMVQPEKVDEAKTVVLAHDIAKRIEKELQYPGQVKVIVIRESRAIDIAK